MVLVASLLATDIPLLSFLLLLTQVGVIDP